MPTFFAPVIWVFERLKYGQKFILLAVLYVFLVLLMTGDFAPSTRLLLAGGGLLLAGYLLGGLYLTLRSSIQHLATEVNRLERGDLATPLSALAMDEMKELCEHLDRLRETLRGTIGTANRVTSDIRNNASGIAASLEQQASVHAEQSAAVSEITSTMEEFSASSSEIADYSSTVVDMATKAWDSTKAGAEAVEGLASHMMEINSDNEDNLKEIVDLGRKSKEISKVIELITNIADQTKLIAFNAALEAAGAGDAGKRFGVVAVEIRRLADSVMESTGETESKIGEIQETINRLVVASEKGSKLIKKGLDYTGKAAEVLEGIVGTARQSMDAAKQISLSTQQQKTASKQVVSALRDIAAGADQTLSSISDLGRVGKDLTVLADDLRALVGRFDVRAE